MVIDYKKSKENKCYMAYVNNPSDRKNIRDFTKHFPEPNLKKNAIEIHQRITSSATIESYNAIYGKTENRIEICKGIADKNPLIFRVKINNAWRKFFYGCLQEQHILKKEWTGQFCDICKITVLEINNHDYTLVK